MSLVVDIASRRPVSLFLMSFGPSKMATIKVIKDGLGVGLSEAKDIVEPAPILVGDFLPDEAERLKKALDGAGAIAVVRERRT